MSPSWGEPLDAMGCQQFPPSNGSSTRPSTQNHSHQTRLKEVSGCAHVLESNELKTVDEGIPSSLRPDLWEKSNL